MAKQKKSKPSNPTTPLLSLDPLRIRYQHSRIRPHFSGCGRSVHSTLQSIQSGEITVDDLPPIQVLVGPSDKDGRWYFSLNNRRLWVFKRLREGGFLEERVPRNTVLCRVREVKSRGERERYTLENCSLDAKFIREKVRDGDDDDNNAADNKLIENETRVVGEEKDRKLMQSFESIAMAATESDHIENDSESESDDEEVSHSNSFSALL